MNYEKDFVAIILTNGRPQNVKTIPTLRKSGYTGRIVLAVDDKDETLPEYIEQFGEMVHVFSKDDIGRRFDKGDNFGSQKLIIYARNASFDIAEKIGCRYFIQLDDDYTAFQWRFDREKYLTATPRIKSLDAALKAMLKFYISIPACASLAMTQGGDFIGGKYSTLAQKKILKRKAMNSFICSTDRRFFFIGQTNEDVNTYTLLGSRGALFFSSNQISLAQLATQSNEGGITEFYAKYGTYVKSFQTVIYQPSSVKVSTMGNTKASSRIHHKVRWKFTTPQIISETHKKK